MADAGDENATDSGVGDRILRDPFWLPLWSRECASSEENVGSRDA